jgi:hypothetical protein
MTQRPRTAATGQVASSRSGAREVLSDAGWLFDDFVNNEMRKVLVSQPEERDQREEAYRRARVATEMKAGLESLIESYDADVRLKERRERKGSRF